MSVISELASQAETRKIYHPEVLVFPTAEDVDLYAANRVILQIQQKPDSVLTLPTGSTPLGLYNLLVTAHLEQGVDMSQLTVFNLDDYWPIRQDHPSSYAHFMQRNFYAYVNIPPERRFIPNGEAPDPDREATRYDELLKEYGPVNLAVLGIGSGATCHIGFNERGSTVDSRTRYMPLEAETKAVNKQFFDNPAEMPAGTLTQGVANILEAKHIILLAKGASKAWGIARSLTGEIGPDAPASYLRYHPQVSFVLDQEAASLLSTA